jgi:hypothetical protein
MQLEHRLIRDADHGAAMPATGGRSFAESQNLSDRNVASHAALPTLRFQELPTLHLVKPAMRRNHRLGVCPQTQQK